MVSAHPYHAYQDPFDGPTPNLQFDQATTTSLPTSSPFAAAAAHSANSPAAATMTPFGAAADTADKDVDAYAQIQAGPAAAAAAAAPGTDVALIEQNPQISRLLPPLKALRMLQVLCISIFILLCIVVLATQGRIRQAVTAAVAADRYAAPGTLVFHPPPGPDGQVIVGLREDEIVEVLMLVLVVFTSTSLAIAIPSLALSSLWLLFTAHPGKRPRRYSSGRTHCTRFTCDLAWDIVCCSLWAAALLLSCLSVGAYAGAQGMGLAVGQIILSAVVLLLHVGSAVLSGVVRRRVQLAAARGCTVYGVQMGAVGTVYPQAVCRSRSPVDELNSMELL